MPSDLGTSVEMVVFTAYTKSLPITVQAVFEPINSCLHFKLKWTETCGSNDNIVTLNLGESIDCSRLDVYHGSSVLEQVDHYNN